MIDAPTATQDMLGTVGALVTRLQEQLGDGSPRVAQDIIAALYDVPRFWPKAHENDQVDLAMRETALRAATRIRRGAPFAYAVGRAAFRHLTMDVDERVLIPRPETELLVDEVLRRVGRSTGIAIDVGTGSGAIALSLASEGAFTRVIATDVSLDALAVAQHNAAQLASVLRAPVEFRHGSLLAPVRDVRAAVVVSNPPYIAYSERTELPSSVRDWEPSLALFSDDDGLATTRQLVREAVTVLEADGVLALEADTRRAALVAELVATEGHYRDVVVRDDLTGRARFVVAQRT